MGNKDLVHTKPTEMAIVISDSVDSKAKRIKQGKKGILHFVRLKSKQLHIGWIQPNSESE